MRALILAAGYATRLMPLTANTAKPLLMVGEKRIIEYIVDNIDKTDIDDIVVVTNNRFYGDFCSWKDSYSSKKKITVLNDLTMSNDDRLGAIGDIKFVVENEGIKDDLLIVGGDNLFDCSIEDVLKFFRQKNASLIGVYDVADKEIAKQYGLVSMSGDARIAKMIEKSGNPDNTLAATCLYVLTAKDLGLLDTYLGEGGLSDAPGYYMEWLVKRSRVYGCLLEGQWFDIGDKAKYEEANQLYKG